MGKKSGVAMRVASMNGGWCCRLLIPNQVPIKGTWAGIQIRHKIVFVLNLIMGSSVLGVVHGEVS